MENLENMSSSSYNTNNINNTNKCAYDGCNKKIKISDLSCKCGKTFCKLHRLPETHMCNFNYKDEIRKMQQIEHMKCVSEKIIKI